MDPQLFGWSYDYVGDLAETVALVWPARPGANREPELSEVVEALRGATRAEVQRLIEGWLDALRADRPLGAAEADDRRPAGRPVRAAGQAGRGRASGEPCRRRRDRGDLARACTRPTRTCSPGWRAAASARRRAPRPLPPGDAGPGDRRGGRLRQARSRPTTPPSGSGTASASRRSARAGVRRLYTPHRRRHLRSLPRRGRRAGLRGRDRRRAAGHARRPGRALRRPAAAAEPQDRRRQADGRTSPPPSAPTTSWPTATRTLRALPFAERRKRLEAFVATQATPAHRPLAAAALRDLGRSWRPCAPIRRPAIRRSPKA